MSGTPERVFGLVDIARSLGISERKLRMLLDLPAGERPPVRMGHRGFYAIKSRLQDWIDAQDMDAGVYRALRRAKSDGSVLHGHADVVALPARTG